MLRGNVLSPMYGRFAARPQANALDPGTIFYALDTGAAYLSDGANWQNLTPAAAAVAPPVAFVALAADQSTGTVLTFSTLLTLPAAPTLSAGSSLKIDVEICAYSVGALATGIFQIFVDGVGVPTNAGGKRCATANNQNAPLSIKMSCKVAVAVGAHVVLVKWADDVGTSWRCNPSSGVQGNATYPLGASIAAQEVV